MTADRSSSVVPRRRFPEFRDAQEWSTPRGDTLFDSINNRRAAPGLPVLAITQEHGAIPRDQIDYHVSVTAESVASYKEVCEGDFIISLRSFQGGIEHSRYHGICSPAYVILRRKGGGNDHFFRHLFKSKRFVQQLTRNIEGIRDGKMISYARFSEQLLPVPEPPEQQKIADCLGSLDDLIAAAGRKLEALRQHKQGLMQQIFPLPKETLPRSRFPEFRDAAEWSLPTLQQLLKIRATYGIVKAGEYLAAGVPMVRGGDIKDGKVSVDLSLVAPEIHEQFERTRLLRNDVVIALVGYPGEAAIIPDVLVGANVSRAVGVLRVAPKLNPHYLAAYLNSPSGRASFLKSSAGSAQIVVNLSDLNALQLPLPEIAEQERIACFVAALIAHFGKQRLKLDALIRHKQGLLQHLFPSPGIK